VYEQLGKIGGASIDTICDDRVSALEPTIRYCRYILQRSGAAGAEAKSSESDLLSMRAGAGGMVDDLLKSKLEVGAWSSTNKLSENFYATSARSLC
jgi:hypothetical protein